jgi:hypothetical protein
VFREDPIMRALGSIVCIAALAASSAYAADVKPPSPPVVSPRDAASGLPTGKRMHKPFVITKDWSSQAQAQQFCTGAQGEFSSTGGKFACTVDLDTPQGLAAAKSAGYDLKAAKGA